MRESNKRTDAPTSFIDEVIIDNMVKGKADFIHHNPLDDLKPQQELALSENSQPQKGEDGKSTDKDAYLYDKTVANGKDVAPQGVDTAAKETTEAKTATTKENETTPAVKQEEEELRVPLQVDIDEAQENDMRKELAYNMPLEVIEAIINAQKEAAREQMRIAELETEAPTEIANRSAPVQTNPPSLATRKK